MANIQGQKKWSPIRLLEAHELARGGENGNLNEQAIALADRTEFLMQEKASKSEIVQGIFEFATYSEFDAVKSTLPTNCTVVIGESSNNVEWGFGYNIWDGTTLTKSSYDVLELIKANGLYKPVLITSGMFSHIDEITQSGYYICESNSIAATINGLPNGRLAFILEVINNDSFTKQTLNYRLDKYAYIRISNTTGEFPNFSKSALDDEMQMLINSRINTLKDELVYENSKNLFNPANAQHDHRLSAKGILAEVEGAICSDFIPVTSGKKYTISWSNTVSDRPFYAFYKTKDNASIIESNSTASTNSPLTLAAPSGANYLIVNVKHNSTSTEREYFQVEEGSQATEYAPFESKGLIIKDHLIPESFIEEKDFMTLQNKYPKSYEQITISKNLFNSNILIEDYYLNTTTGRLVGTAGWTLSHFIPVTPGKKYTISGQRSRHGVAFFSTDVITNDAAILYNNSNLLPLTLTAPEGANFMIISLESAAVKGWSNIQVEEGSQATEYIPFGQANTSVDASSISGLDEFIQDSKKAKLDLTNGVGTVSTDKLSLGVQIFVSRNHQRNSVFNFSGDFYDGLKIRSFDDDVSPVRMLDTTIGGNHGYFRTLVTAASHGKTKSDIGSIWEAAGKQWVIVEIVSATAISITSRYDNTSLSTLSTLTHVEGATNTASFTPTAVSSGSYWYPVVTNHSVDLLVDNKRVTDINTKMGFNDSISVIETYDIAEKNEMVEYLIQNRGQDILDYKARPVININHIHKIHADCTDVIYSNFFTHASIANAKDIMFTQAARLDLNVAGAVKYYVPRSVPFTHESVNYDFSVPTVVDDFNWSQRVFFTADKTEPDAVLPDRLIQFNDRIGFAIGYLPVLDAAPEVRNLRTSCGLSISTNRSKIYPYLVDSLTSLDAGAQFSAVAYRRYFSRPTDTRRTVEYDIPSTYGDFLFLDWHDGNFIDKIILPDYMKGRKFEVVEKTNNIDVLTRVATGQIAVNVGIVTTNARLILRFVD